MYNTQSGIYCIENITNGKVYIGSTSHLQQRFRQHFHLLRQGTHENSYLQNAFTKAGSGVFRVEVLEYCPSGSLLEREDWWITLLGALDRDRGYNLKTANRHEMSKETRAKLSATLTGRKLTEETKAKISTNNGARRPEVRAKSSASHTGKKHTTETRAKLSSISKGNKYNLGRILTPEHRANLSAALKGKPWSEARRNAHNITQPLQVETE